uniref:Uncharacterized protein n=1 Tax=Anguilla anguilla TaxID=7936 RepID=A0A0E9WU31_ANGAN
MATRLPDNYHRWIINPINRYNEYSIIISSHTRTAGCV